MPNIGIVDDKESQRVSLARLIDSYLEDDFPKWKCIDIYPFKEKTDFINWILEEDISVLILDENLQEGPSKELTNVNYNGHQLVDTLRNAFPTFPIIAITAYSDDTDGLNNKKNAFDGIYKRTEIENTDIVRLVRHGQQFTKTHQEELEKLSNVAKAIATGKYIPPEELKEAKAIQERIRIPQNFESMVNRVGVLKEFEERLEELEKITNKINQFLKK